MPAKVKDVYYPEMQRLVQEATGASRVIVFDHTVRESSLKNLNNLGASGVAAASVVRVHCDYTEVFLLLLPLLYCLGLIRSCRPINLCQSCSQSSASLRYKRAMRYSANSVPPPAHSPLLLPDESVVYNPLA